MSHDATEEEENIENMHETLHFSSDEVEINNEQTSTKGQEQLSLSADTAVTNTAIDNTMTVSASSQQTRTRITRLQATSSSTSQTPHTNISTLNKRVDIDLTSSLSPSPPPPKTSHKRKKTPVTDDHEPKPKGKKNKTQGKTATKRGRERGEKVKIEKTISRSHLDRNAKTKAAMKKLIGTSDEEDEDEDMTTKAKKQKAPGPEPIKYNETKQTPAESYTFASEESFTWFFGLRNVQPYLTSMLIISPSRQDPIHPPSIMDVEDDRRKKKTEEMQKEYCDYFPDIDPADPYTESFTASFNSRVQKALEEKVEENRKGLQEVLNSYFQQEQNKIEAAQKESATLTFARKHEVTIEKALRPMFNVAHTFSEIGTKTQKDDPWKLEFNSIPSQQIARQLDINPNTAGETAEKTSRALAKGYPMLFTTESGTRHDECKNPVTITIDYQGVTKTATLNSTQCSFLLCPAMEQQQRNADFNKLSSHCIDATKVKFRLTSFVKSFKADLSEEQLESLKTIQRDTAESQDSFYSEDYFLFEAQCEVCTTSPKKPRCVTALIIISKEELESSDGNISLLVDKYVKSMETGINEIKLAQNELNNMIVERQTQLMGLELSEEEEAEDKKIQASLEERQQKLKTSTCKVLQSVQKILKNDKGVMCEVNLKDVMSRMKMYDNVKPPIDELVSCRRFIHAENSIYTPCGIFNVAGQKKKKKTVVKVEEVITLNDYPTIVDFDKAKAGTDPKWENLYYFGKKHVFSGLPLNSKFVTVTILDCVAFIPYSINEKQHQNKYQSLIKADPSLNVEFMVLVVGVLVSSSSVQAQPHVTWGYIYADPNDIDPEYVREMKFYFEQINNSDTIIDCIDKHWRQPKHRFCTTIELNEEKYKQYQDIAQKVENPMNFNEYDDQLYTYDEKSDYVPVMQSDKEVFINVFNRENLTNKVIPYYKNDTEREEVVVAEEREEYLYNIILTKMPDPGVQRKIEDIVMLCNSSNKKPGQKDYTKEEVVAKLQALQKNEVVVVLDTSLTSYTRHTRQQELLAATAHQQLVDTGDTQVHSSSVRLLSASEAKEQRLEELENKILLDLEALEQDDVYPHQSYLDEVNKASSEENVSKTTFMGILKKLQMEGKLRLEKEKNGKGSFGRPSPSTIQTISDPKRLRCAKILVRDYFKKMDEGSPYTLCTYMNENRRAKTDKKEYEIEEVKTLLNILATEPDAVFEYAESGNMLVKKKKQEKEKESDDDE